MVGENSESCSKVTVPLIWESPRTVATVEMVAQGQQDEVVTESSQSDTWGRSGDETERLE